MRITCVIKADNGRAITNKVTNKPLIAFNKSDLLMFAIFSCGRSLQREVTLNLYLNYRPNLKKRIKLEINVTHMQKIFKQIFLWFKSMSDYDHEDTTYRSTTLMKYSFWFPIIHVMLQVVIKSSFRSYITKKYLVIYYYELFFSYLRI